MSSDMQFSELTFKAGEIKTLTWDEWCALPVPTLCPPAVGSGLVTWGSPSVGIYVVSVDSEKQTLEVECRVTDGQVNSPETGT